MKNTTEPSAGETAQHTPGPWILEERRDGEIGVSRPGYWRNFVTVYAENPSIQPGEGHANARLIAAAPDLLAVAKGLEILCATLVSGGVCPRSLLDFNDIARAAIAKAGGGK